MGTWGAKRKRSSRPTQYASKPYSQSVMGTFKTRRDNVAISKVKSAVASMKRQLATTTQKLYFRNAYTDFSGSSLGGNSASYRNLMRYDQWGTVFGTDADDAAGKQAVVRSIDLDWQVYGNTEAAYVDCTVFVLRLKEESAVDLTTGGDFVASNWPVQSTDMAYSAAQATSEHAGLSAGFWNPKKYQVLYQKRCVLGSSNGTPGTITNTGVAAVANAINVGRNVYRGRKKLTFGKRGLVLKNASGDWKTTLRPLDVKNNIFFVVVTNDFSGDVQVPLHSMNALITLDS